MVFNYKVTLAIALLLIICVSVFAVEVTDVTPQSQIPNSDYAKLNAEMQTKFIQLNNKIDKMPSTEVLLDLMNKQVNAQEKIISNFKSQLIISQIISGVCLLALFFSIIFYFKSRGRL